MGFELIQIKSVLNKHRKRDPWFQDDYSVNPYKGCSFNCVYCYTLGSRYGQVQPGKVMIKENAADVLRKQLERRARRRQYGFIALGSSTEPYMKIEEKTGLSRKMLEIIRDFKFPVVVLTKSTLVRRDFDLIFEIGENAVLPDDTCANRGAFLIVSISTMDEEISKKLEPGAPPPSERLKIVKEAIDEGISAGVAFIPVLPFISDTEEELERMVSEASFADFVFVGSLTLFGTRPGDSKARYFEFLKRYDPDLIPRYKRLFRIFSAPPSAYQRKLMEVSRRLSRKYSVNLGLPGCEL